MFSKFILGRQLLTESRFFFGTLRAPLFQVQLLHNTYIDHCLCMFRAFASPPCAPAPAPLVWAVPPRPPPCPSPPPSSPDRLLVLAHGRSGLWPLHLSRDNSTHSACRHAPSVRVRATCRTHMRSPPPPPSPAGHSCARPRYHLSSSRAGGDSELQQDLLAMKRGGAASRAALETRGGRRSRGTSRGCAAEARPI